MNIFSHLFYPLIKGVIIVTNFSISIDYDTHIFLHHLQNTIQFQKSSPNPYFFQKLLFLYILLFFVLNREKE